MTRTTASLLCILCFAASLYGQVVATSSGYATLQGPGVQSAPISWSDLTTPVVNLSLMPPLQVGATNATGSNQAGATNSTIAGPPNQTSTPAVEPGYFDIEALAQAAAGRQGAPDTRLVVNLGPGQFDSAYARTSLEERRSLGQVARLYRQQTPARRARVYTNEDVERVGGVQKPKQ